VLSEQPVSVSHASANCLGVLWDVPAGFLSAVLTDIFERRARSLVPTSAFLSEYGHLFVFHDSV